ncbi:Hypothetical predicted protein [Olea europaea subsp. europaea]|uniref:Uncharacterized protein n=1 Tax=Olea europaea subsp. europaea TaxID=158383 RepID=A0A8S0QFC7_OLEEU|nr:Hypothetical predicted protein [Olea europaea subsp. europaea]
MTIQGLIIEVWAATVKEFEGISTTKYHQAKEITRELETETGVFFNWAWWLLRGSQRSKQGLNFSDVHNIKHESHFFFFVDFVAGPEKELISVASPPSSVREGGDGNEEVGKGSVLIWAIFRED